MKQFKIWYLSTEISPFAKTGGLADVASSFPKALKQKDQEIRTMMPKYKSINERKYVLREVIRLREIPVKINGVLKMANAKSAFLPDSKVQVYFIDFPEFFSRNGLYTDSNSGNDFTDNAERFAYFSMGALETLKILSWKPDIIHCNDWQTAFIPIYLKTVFKDDEFMQGIKTVFTIHNLSFQGIFEINTAKQLGLNDDLVDKNGPLYWNDALNLVKGAIHFSDFVTTVSQNYAREIISKPEYGYGLEKSIQQKGDNFQGILNGIDYSVWAPQNDKHIPYKYSPEDLSGKEQNKQALLSRVGLEYDENTPVCGMISRVTEQKGYGLLLEIVDDLVNLNLQLVVLGTGDKQLEKQIEQAQKKYPKHISINKAFDETLAHMIEAGSDFFLMPSNFEPCGMNQIYSLKYGTIPIVYKTGGLADTISTFSVDASEGNGYVFNRYKSNELLRAIKKAVKLYANKVKIETIRKRIMQQDFSWDISVDEYLNIYEKLVSHL